MFMEPGLNSSVKPASLGDFTPCFPLLRSQTPCTSLPRPSCPPPLGSRCARLPPHLSSWKQWAAVITQRSPMRAPPQMCRPRTWRLACHGHSPSEDTAPPTMRPEGPWRPQSGSGERARGGQRRGEGRSSKKQSQRGGRRGTGERKERREGNGERGMKDRGSQGPDEGARWGQKERHDKGELSPGFPARAPPPHYTRGPSRWTGLTAVLLVRAVPAVRPPVTPRVGLLHAAAVLTLEGECSTRHPWGRGGEGGAQRVGS